MSDAESIQLANVVSRQAAAPLSTKIEYRLVSTFPGWEGAPEFLSKFVELRKPKTILEIGSGANPTLPPEQIPPDIRYITSDADAAELAKAPPGYTARLLDLEKGMIPEDLHDSCDLVFSRMVNEHVRDGKQYHANIRRILAPGGLAVHCFATLYALPFVVNRFLPDSLSTSIYNRVAKRENEHTHGKFQAHYGWSRGPTQHMIRQYQSIGYEVLEYDGYFGHCYYDKKLKFLSALEKQKARLLLKMPMPLLCAYATVVLRRPAGG